MRLSLTTAWYLSSLHSRKQRLLLPLLFKFTFIVETKKLIKLLIILLLLNPLSILISLHFPLLLLFPLHLLLPVTLKLLHAFHLFLFFFVLLALDISGYNLGTVVVLYVIYFVQQFDIVFAVIALVCLVATEISMVIPFREVYLFITKLTGSRLHLTLLIMISVFESYGREGTELAFYCFMHLFFVLFLVSLCYTLTTFFALVILTRASDIMHSELGDIDL
jgi:hypothetical protein